MPQFSILGSSLQRGKTGVLGGFRCLGLTLLLGRESNNKEKRRKKEGSLDADDGNRQMEKKKRTW